MGALPRLKTLNLNGPLSNYRGLSKVFEPSRLLGDRVAMEELGIASGYSQEVENGIRDTLSDPDICLWLQALPYTPPEWGSEGMDSMLEGRRQHWAAKKEAAAAAAVAAPTEPDEEDEEGSIETEDEDGAGEQRPDPGAGEEEDEEETAEVGGAEPGGSSRPKPRWTGCVRASPRSRPRWRSRGRSRLACRRSRRGLGSRREVGFDFCF